MSFLAKFTGLVSKCHSSTVASKLLATAVFKPTTGIALASANPLFHNNNQHQLFQQQIRFGSRHLGKPLKGKIHFLEKYKKKLKEKRNPQRLVREALSVLQKRSKMFSWEPTSETQEAYQKLNDLILQQQQRPKASHLNNMFKNAQSKFDFDCAIKMWRIWSDRGLPRNEDTTEQFIQACLRFGDVAAAVELLKHCIVLKMPVSHTGMVNFLSALFEKKEDATALAVFNMYTLGRFNVFPNAEAFFLVIDYHLKNGQLDKALEVHKKEIELLEKWLSLNGDQAKEGAAKPVLAFNEPIEVFVYKPQEKKSRRKKRGKKGAAAVQPEPPKPEPKMIEKSRHVAFLEKILPLPATYYQLFEACKSADKQPEAQSLVEEIEKYYKGEEQVTITRVIMEYNLWTKNYDAALEAFASLVKMMQFVNEKYAMQVIGALKQEMPEQVQDEARANELKNKLKAVIASYESQEATKAKKPLSAAVQSELATL
eukprot:GEZU01042695.1.p1 GENE.GEZU01042695.1~~GEZU01042695.1.p1  ORF type:complete len:483 (-),score=171.14 GEZU01042695.1:182-1630(-)